MYFLSSFVTVCEVENYKILEKWHRLLSFNFNSEEPLIILIQSILM